MVASKAERDLVLFLGAGFSRDAGLPIMSEFGASSRRAYRRCRMKQDRREMGPIYVKAGAVFRKFQQFCSRGGSVLSIDHDNMEVVFCVAEALRQTLGSSAKILRSYGRDYTAAEVYEQIQVWLWKMYQVNPLPRDWRQSRYTTFVKALKNAKAPEKVAVITTNYDLVFESFAWRVGLPCEYAVANSRRISGGGRTESYLASGPGPRPLLVCKLHGSINYFTDSGEDEQLFICDDVLKSGDYVTEDGRVRHGGTERPWVLSFDAVTRLRRKYKGDFVPALIPPTYGKLEQFDWLRRIWRSAFDALRSAKKLVFIGYSMAESDGHLRAMIQSAMSKRTLASPPEVYVFDPSPEALVRYRQFFAPLKLASAQHLWGMDFATTCDTKLPDVL